MGRTNRTRLFDDWAKHYDRSVESNDEFPFDGYAQVLDEITRISCARSGMTILDLGIGTGNLAARFTKLGCSIWGIDFSSEMLARVGELLPQATLVQADLLEDWPFELQQRFDRIVSAYVFHEFDLPTKTKLLQRLVQHHLVSDGHIVIGDIAFPTVAAREEAHRRWAKQWDEDEYYWAADETMSACGKAGLHAQYSQLSSCGGVFVVRLLGSKGTVA